LHGHSGSSEARVVNALRALRATGRGTFGRQIALGSVVVLLGLVGALAGLLAATSETQETSRSARHSRDVLLASANLQKLVFDLERAERGFLITGREQLLVPWHRAGRAFGPRAELLRRLVANDPAQERRARAIGRAGGSYLHEYATPLIVAAHGRLSHSQATAATAEGERRLVALRSQFDALDRREQALLVSRSREEAGERALASRLGWAAIVASALLVLGFAFVLFRSIVRPLRAVTDATRLLGRGDPAARAAEIGTGEAAELARSFNAMADSLERDRAELADRNSFLATLIEMAPLAVVALDPDGIVTLWNSAAAEIFGWTHEEVIGQPMPWVPDELRAESAVFVARGLAGERCTGRRIRRRRRDGAELELSLSTGPLRDARGEAIGVLGFLEDVTEAAAAERARRETEERQRLSFLRAPIGNALVAPDGRWLQVNPALVEMFGYPEQELLAKTFADITHPEDLEADLAFVQRMLAGEIASYQMEKRYLHRSGDIVRALLSVSLVRDAEGEPLYFVSQIQDITERQLLETARARLAAIVESSADAIMSTDRDGIITSWNAGAERLLGHTRDEAIGQPLSIVAPPDGATEHAERARRVAAGEIVQLETVHARKDGTPVDVSLTLSPTLDGTGRVSGHSAIVRDISRRRAAERQLEEAARRLEQSNTELAQFASVASHDLREPLRKVQAFGDRLSRKYGELLPDDGRDYLARMIAATQRMESLIDGLLAMSRVGARETSVTAVDLEQVARDVVADLEARLDRSGGEVRIGPLPAVAASPLEMHQLLLNLVGNALKFQRADVPPQVEVVAEPCEDPRFCRISVRDNGIGFDERYRERIFGVFQRLHGRDEYEGTGIGLAICRKIAERNGGTIEARSAPGEGSTFAVTLPRHEEHVAA
jgi:PAS domain S-box-containing protein